MAYTAYTISGTVSTEVELSIQLLNIANELSRIADVLERIENEGVSVKR